MPHARIITENSLDTWTQGNAIIAQGVIVELIYRLVAASVPRPKARRFPLGDSIGQHGADGFLDTDIGLDPFVPDGTSYWEIGTGKDAKQKATNDYRGLTQAIPQEERRNSTFVFVTPLSGRTTWKDTWKEDDQSSWLASRRKEGDWKQIEVIDGTRIIDWLSAFPAVEIWFANQIGIPAHEIQTPELHWADLKNIGSPPPFTPDVFLVNREAGSEMLREVFKNNIRQLRIDTRHPSQVIDFTSAFVAKLEESEQVDAAGRCLILSSEEAWNVAVRLNEPHILLAAFDLDRTDSAALLLERANRKGHLVIYSGMPGGMPVPYRVALPNPKSHQLQEALRNATYPDERARALSQKCDGDLSALLRCVQGLSLMPEWVEGTEAGDLVIANLLGGWNETSTGDKDIAETLSGNSYWEWIGRIREASLRPTTPLIHTDGTWKIGARYEAWYALGPRIFDDHLSRIKEAAIKVFRERDPLFDIPPEERYLSAFKGKSREHSNLLRINLAESLALLGSHPKALTSCSFGRAEATAFTAVRDILEEADWELWAGLTDVLPLLAEAAPGAFLSSVEVALSLEPCPFDAVFAQETSGITGRTYMTGLLWGLESLAWAPEYLARVVVILGELAAKDPGGNWGNRPANSLRAILLPWLPQTCAAAPIRLAAMATLLKEVPEVGWELLLSLLPGTHQSSSGTHRPTWKETIPEGWNSQVSQLEYWDQVGKFAEMVAHAAQKDTEKLGTLIDHLHQLPPQARRNVLEHLGAEDVTKLSEADRLPLWSALASLISKHRKFADADWAISAESISEIEVVSEKLKPTSPLYRHQRLFGEREYDLYEELDNFQEQAAKLELTQRTAVSEIFQEGGMEAVLEFASNVDAPWRVGSTFATVANEQEASILPNLLVTEQKPLTQFAGGFVVGSFRTQGWDWIDSIDTSKWNREAMGRFLAYLPFSPEAWDRATKLLGPDETEYWKRANANPYEAENALERGIKSLIKYGRPGAAARCAAGMLHDKKPLNSDLAVTLLLALLDSPEDARALDNHSLVEIITALQDAPDADKPSVMRLEWAFLPLLDRFSGGSPKVLERRLAAAPPFFCEVIGAAFWSKKQERPEEISDQQRYMAKNAYQLLDGWTIPPGRQADGQFTGEDLLSWIQEVKGKCKETGHLEAALTMVGHVLTYVPNDPDGLWIHHAAASVLNERDAEAMRQGFSTKLFNSRGVHWGSGGQEERELAHGYSAQAEAVERHGYHRLATSLRELAAGYVRDAEYESSRDLTDD